MSCCLTYAIYLLLTVIRGLTLFVCGTRTRELAVLIYIHWITAVQGRDAVEKKMSETSQTKRRR